jgi:hypothetical protein
MSKPAPTQSDLDPADAEPAFDRAEPAVVSTPLVHLSAHSGRYYPKAMTAASNLDAVAIRRSETPGWTRLSPPRRARAGSCSWPGMHGPMWT